MPIVAIAVAIAVAINSINLISSKLDTKNQGYFGCGKAVFSCYPQFLANTNTIPLKNVRI
jgi:hypothetical protein